MNAAVIVLPVAFVSGALTCGLTEWARRALHAGGVIDVPNHRSSHDRQVPRGGGIAVMTSISLLSVTSWLMGGSGLTTLAVALATAFMLGLVGFRDDQVGLPIRVRLVAQSLAGVIVASVAMSHVNTLPALNILGIAFLSTFLIGAVNLYNFMDGIDGLATATAAVFGASSFAMGSTIGLNPLALLGAVMFASSLGFLRHNWSPARIFLGDCGSLFLGSLCASIPLMAAVYDLRSLLLLGSLAPFFIDGSGTMIRRWRMGAPLMQAHRAHVYQHAARRWGHARVSLAYSASAALCGLAPAALLLASTQLAIAAAATGALVSFATWLVVSTRLGAVSQ